MSDEIPGTQQSKIITGLCRIFYFYLRRPAPVKSKLDDVGPPWRVILPVNLTFLGNRYGEGRCHKRSFLGVEFTVISTLRKAELSGSGNAFRWSDGLDFSFEVCSATPSPNF